jgi:signal transduction histidine kinase/Tfp pilus assembly protein PilF
MLRILWITVFFIHSLVAAYGQNNSPQTDSLLHRLDKARDNEKAALLNQIAKSCIPGNPSQCLNYAEQALEISKRQNNLLQTAIAFYNIGVANYNQNHFDEALTSYSSSLQILEKIDNKPQKVLVFTNMGLVYREKNNYVEANKAFSQALELCRTMGDTPGMATAHNMLGSLAIRQGKPTLALYYYNEALKIRETLKNNKDIAASYANVAIAYRDMNNFDKALEFNLQALEIREKINNPAMVANTLNEIGNVYHRKQDFEKALEYYFRSIKIRYEGGDKNEIASSFLNIGNIYSNLNNLDKAREYYQQALNIFSEEDNQRRMSYTLNLLGNIEFSEKNYQQAMVFHSRALEYRKKIGVKADIAASLNNLGNVYSELNQTAKATSLLTEALQIRNEIKDAGGQIATLNDLGNLYEKSNNNPKAKASFEEAYKLANATNNSYYIGLCSRKLAEGLLDLHQTQKAFDLLEISYRAGVKINNAELRKNALFSLSQYYKKSGDFEKALDHFQHYAAIQDSQQLALSTRKMLGIQQNLELVKKNNELKSIESEVTLLRQEKAIQAMDLQRKNLLLIFLALVLIFALIVGILIHNRSQIQKKSHALLTQQYALVEEANERLRNSEEELTKLNASKDKFFAVIAHDIKNPLSGLLNLSQIIIEKFDTLKAEEIQSFNLMIHESASNLFNLLENLLNWARANTNKMRFSPLPMKLLPVVNTILVLNKLSASSKKIEIRSEVPDDIEVYADLNMLTSILRNLLSNAIKFTSEGGLVIIKAVDKYRMIEISVTDNGIGLVTSDIEKLFRLDKHFTTPGTGNETGSGLGLILVKEFVEKNKGKVTVTSEPAKGSTFTFTLPTGR